MNKEEISTFEKFKFKSGEALVDKAKALGYSLPYQDDISPLFYPVTIGNFEVPNRLAVQPMEGFDSMPDGSPGDLTFRRYQRYASGGSGLIWFEATAVSEEGRSNPRQLWLHETNVDEFKRLVEKTRKAAFDSFGQHHEPFLVLQLTHSGRFSRPRGKREPKLAAFNPYLDTDPDNIAILPDDELKQIRNRYIFVSDLASRAGFNAVDIKVCHGYLLHDLLVSFYREDSQYGGPELEKRTRLLFEILNSIEENNPEIIMAVRLNLYDAIPYPYGFGVPFDGSLAIDFREPYRLVQKLVEKGCRLINGTLGIPQYNPFISRPHNKNVKKKPDPPENPLEGVARMIRTVRAVQKTHPHSFMVGTGYSYLREHFPNVGAAVIERGEATFIGLGRSSFAYPDAPKDLINNGKLDPKKVCTTCSRCTALMINDLHTGCPVRDKEFYKKEYEKIKWSKKI